MRKAVPREDPHGLIEGYRKLDDANALHYSELIVGIAYGRIDVR